MGMVEKESILAPIQALLLQPNLHEGRDAVAKSWILQYPHHISTLVQSTEWGTWRKLWAPTPSTWSPAHFSIVVLGHPTCWEEGQQLLEFLEPLPAHLQVAHSQTHPGEKPWGFGSGWRGSACWDKQSDINTQRNQMLHSHKHTRMYPFHYVASSESQPQLTSCSTHKYIESVSRTGSLWEISHT